MIKKTKELILRLRGITTGAAQKIHTTAKKRLPLQHESKLKRLFGWVLYIGLLGFFGVLFTSIVVVGVFSIGLPDVRDFEKLAGVESTLILDREGGILYSIHGEENRKYVPITEISPFLQNATVAIEDDQFFEHSGFDIPGIVRAVWVNATSGKRQGGSTITQQLAKNAFFSSERTYTRKIRELIISVRLERAYDKKKILELYLNRIPYGGNAYGAELAAQIYFGKKAKELDLAESAVLASLPKAPTFYSPYGDYSHSTLDTEFTPSILEKRDIDSVADLNVDEYTIGLVGKKIQLNEDKSIYIPGRVDLVLQQMVKLDMITEEEKSVALKETHQIEFKRYRADIRAPHFVFYIRRLIEEKFGKEALEQGGLVVTTTIDPKLQDKAQQLVEDQVALNATNVGATNGALFSVDAKTGEVLAMVGSADYFNDEIDGQVNMVFGRKQPGSSFKPFVYAKAFLNRYAPATVLYDTYTDFGGGYKPDNFNGKFEGPMSIRRALGQSRNIPAIKAYFLAGQEDEILDFVEKLGISGIKARKPVGGFGPALAIGAGEVTMFDMVRAYVAFANTGLQKEIVPMLKVEDRNKKILYEWDPQKDIKEIEVIDPQVAYLINDVLSDESVKLGQRLTIPGHAVATKTGTSNKEIRKDVIRANNMWSFGYTPQIVTGVWTGNTDGKELALGAEAYSASTPIWQAFMKEALKDLPNEPFPSPAGITSVKVSKASGLLPGPDTPEDQIISDKFASFSVPTEVDTSFVHLAVNKTTKQISNPVCSSYNVETKLFQRHKDPIDTYGTWAVGVQRWVAKQRETDPNFPDFPPDGDPPIALEKNLPAINILTPSAFSTVDLGQTPVTVNVSAPRGVDKVEFYIDGSLHFVTTKYPFDGKIRITKFTPKGKKTLTSRAFDHDGCTAESNIEVMTTETTNTEEVPVNDTSEGEIAPSP